MRTLGLIIAALATTTLLPAAAAAGPFEDTVSYWCDVNSPACDNAKFAARNVDWQYLWAACTAERLVEAPTNIAYWRGCTVY